MGKFKIKNISFIIFIILSLTLLNCQEDNGVFFEDDDVSQENSDRGQDTHTKSRPGRIEEDEEFDDPVLLKKSEKNKVESNPTGKAIYKNPFEDKKLLVENKEPEKKQLYFAYYEVLMGLFVIIFIVNCYIGKTKNENLAKKWYVANKNFFEENYAHLGHGKEYNAAAAPLLKESYNSFKFYASGRVFLKRLLTRMEFKKRQDLVSLCTGVFLFNDKDRIIYDASISPLSEIPIVFSLCKKKETPNMKKTYSEIKHLTSKTDFHFMSDKLDFMTEDQEIFEEIFKDKNFLAIYKKIEDFIDIIYFSDTQSFTSDEYGMFLSFDLDFGKKIPEEVFSDINLFVHAFIDQLCLYSPKISSQYIKSTEKRRAEYERIKIKELQEKNSDETKQNKLDKLAEKSKKATTPEQAQKYEELLKKEQMKSLKKKQMKLVKK